MREALTYPGRDLEAMSFAENYHRWILQTFEPFLGTRLVEVGAGSGSFSELLLERQAESLSLVEPSAGMYGLLEERVCGRDERSRVQLYNAVFRQVADRLRASVRPDSIIYVNVLEHVADDESELRAIQRTLSAGGRVFIFVPAFQWLFGKFDAEVGHFRRYTRPELEDKCRRAGFRVLMSKYFDLVGVLPWWVKYRLLGSGALEPRVVGLYDQYVVPVTRALEGIITPPFGKNVILVAEKVET